MALNSHSLDLEKSSTQYATAVDSASLSITGDLTVEAWVKFESLPPNNDGFIIVEKYFGGTNQHSYYFSLYNSAGTLKLNGITSANGSVDTDVTVDWTPSTDTWYHVAVVFDIGIGTKFYVNGVQQGTTQAVAASIFDSTAPLAIGNNSNGVIAYGASFDGKIDEIRIWSMARSEAQLAANKDDHIDPSTANLNAYWRFNNSEADSTTNGNALTLQNTPSYSTDVPFIGTGGAFLGLI